MLALNSPQKAVAVMVEINACQRIWHELFLDRVAGDHEQLRPLLNQIHGWGNGTRYALHSQKDIRDRAYKIFSQDANLEQASNIVDDLRSKTGEMINEVLTRLEKMPPEERKETLSSFQSWKKWIQQIDPPIPKNFVQAPEGLFDEKFLKKTRALMKKLEEQGIQTRLVSGPENSRSGEGVLLIESLQSVEIRREPITPAGKVFQSQDFKQYVDLAKEGDGAIVVDPRLVGAKAGAYFWANPDVVPGKKWVLALGPRGGSTGSVFMHEWEHKLDRIDHADRYAESLNKNNLYRDVSGEAPTGGLKRAAQLVGSVYEHQFLTELNATGRQFKLYFESRLSDIDHEDVMNTIIYRSINESKVAIGRILMDPKNPDHYRLYVRSLAGRPIAVSIYYTGAMYTTSLGLASLMGFIKNIDDKFREDQKKKSQGIVEDK